MFLKTLKLLGNWLHLCIQQFRTLLLINRKLEHFSNNASIRRALTQGESDNFKVTDSNCLLGAKLTSSTKTKKIINRECELQ